MVPNNNYGVTHANLEMYMLHFGCEINNKQTICMKCKHVMDKCGHNALICKHGNH